MVPAMRAVTAPLGLLGPTWPKFHYNVRTFGCLWHGRRCKKTNLPACEGFSGGVEFREPLPELRSYSSPSRSQSQGFKNLHRRLSAGFVSFDPPRLEPPRLTTAGFGTRLCLASNAFPHQTGRLPHGNVPRRSASSLSLLSIAGSSPAIS